MIDLGAVMATVRGDDFFSESPSVVEVHGVTGMRGGDFRIGDFSPS